MNQCSSPGSFIPAAAVTLPVNFSDPREDWQRMRAEHWCFLRTRGRWLRRRPRDTDMVVFEFEDPAEAAAFRRAHPKARASHSPNGR